MLRVVVLTLMVAMTAGVSATERCDVWFEMKQLWTMQQAFDKGASENMGYTLAAITWKESSAGLKLYRKDGEHWSMRSYGPFHILLKTAKNRRGCASWNCSGVKRRLVNDFDYSADLALEELAYWKERLGGHRRSLAAYNSGNAWRSSTGTDYSTDIRRKVAYLQQCVRF